MNIDIIGGQQGSSAAAAAGGGFMAGGIPGAVIGGGLSLLGGMFSNSANAREAEKNRKFQYDVMRTGHQVEMRDLAEAGLNPILTATGGPGAKASGGAQAQMSDPVTPAISSALSVARQKTELNLIDAQTQKALAEKNQTVALTPGAAGLQAAQTGLAQMQTNAAEAGIRLTGAQADRVASEIRELDQRVRESSAREGLLNTEKAHKDRLLDVLKEELPGLLHAAGISSSDWGNAARWNKFFSDNIDLWLDKVGKLKPGLTIENKGAGAYKLEPGPSTLPQHQPAPNPSSAKGIYSGGPKPSSKALQRGRR